MVKPFYVLWKKEKFCACYDWQGHRCSTLTECINQFGINNKKFVTEFKKISNKETVLKSLNT